MSIQQNVGRGRMSRDEVIKLLKLIKSTVYLGNRKFFDALESAISYLRQPELQWIPCSERLPDNGIEVFVYLYGRPSPYIAWVEDCHWYTEEFEVEKEYYPLAWMPLPEPYAERREE